MIDFKKLIQPSYILDSQPRQFQFLLPAVIIFGAAVIASILIWIFLKTSKAPYKEKIKSAISNWLLWLGISGLILVFFRWQEIPYLSARILFEILFLVFLIWLGFILKYLIFNYKKDKDNFAERMRFEKYLPKKR